MTAYERTGWRDSSLSARHRLWGPCHLVDLDWFVLEHDRGDPVALVDYKKQAYPRRPVLPDLTSANYQAQRKLADASRIPFLIVFYWESPWSFCIYPVNQAGKAQFGDMQPMSEYGYVMEMHRLRHRVAEQSLGRVLDHTQPPFEESRDAAD